MTKSPFAGFAAILLIAALSAPALAQSAASPGAATKTPGAATKPRPGGKPPAAGGQSVPGTANLTAGECKRLGGTVYTAPNCTKTGTRCVMKLAGGDIRAPCIDEVE
jgi:hypothetical protein